MIDSIITFECECTTTKNHKVTFDGATSGNYIVEMCEQCFKADDGRFILLHEVL